MVDLSLGLKLEDCSLYMAGQCKSVPSADSFGNVYRLVCVRNGAGRLLGNRGDFLLEKNGIALLLVGEEVSFSGENDGVYLDSVVLSVDSKRYREVFALVDSERPELGSRIFNDENISNLISYICKEIECDSMAYSTELLSLMSSQLVVYFIRRFGLELHENSDNNLLNVKVCTRVMNYIDSHIFTMKNLREVASEMGYNYSYISSLFHKTVGITLNNYFKNKRMSEAKKLLADSGMSVSEIARIMNYSSVYAFSKAFKEHFGASPGHYSGRLPNKE